MLNKTLGRTYANDDLLWYIRNVFEVLLTRGIRGTYDYIPDPALRDNPKQFVSQNQG